MNALLKESKELFRANDQLQSLDICTYCCVSEEYEQLLLQSNRFEVPTKAIYEYNSSAKSGYTLETTNELKYFTPRILELVVLDEEIHHSTELYLTRFDLVPKEAWSLKEIDFFNRFAAAFIKQRIVQKIRARRGSLLKIFTMLNSLPIDMAPHLPLLLNARNSSSVLFFSEFYLYEVNWSKRRVDNPFMEKELEKSVLTFFLQKDTIQQLIEMIEHVVWVKQVILSKEEENIIDLLYVILNNLSKTLNYAK